MGLRQWLKPRIQDYAMRFMDDLREPTVGAASGDVLEVGFGTARNLEHYGAQVARVTGLDPMSTQGVAAVESRIARARFPVERAVLRADATLPFDTARFDTVVTTFTLCSIPDPAAALAEMRRVL
ncbi:MAG TPA: class I SAM-dependent methyltransferase, partial [Myxococcota bacterium]|nr:class I SAM-dependent methyltransferase [Myxococcota bacterium]